MNDTPPITPASENPWASVLGGAGAMGMLGLLGMGLGRKRKGPETKREKASAALESLSALYDDLESMTVDANCLLGSEAQGTISPFSAETNVVVGEIVLLRRRVLLAKAKLHAFSIPKVRESLVKLTKEVDAAEASITEILKMPDMSVEQEAALKQASRDKSLVVQALTMPGAPHAIAVVAKNSGVPLDRTDVALAALVADGLVETSGEGFKWIGRKAEDDAKPAP